MNKFTFSTFPESKGFRVIMRDGMFYEVPNVTQIYKEDHQLFSSRDDEPRHQTYLFMCNGVAVVGLFKMDEVLIVIPT